MALNETSTDQPYIYGRLIAFLERLHFIAYGKPWKTDYVSLSASYPPKWIPYLMGEAQHELRDIRCKSREKASHLDEELGDMICLLDPNVFPIKRLGLEGEGNFRVGYYYQKEAYRKHA